MCAELGMCICYDWITLLIENEPNAYGTHFCVMTETNVVFADICIPVHCKMQCSAPPFMFAAFPVAVRV